MSLPDMIPPPAGPYQERSLIYHGGVCRRVYWTDEERRFPDELLIVSRTDLHGIITHANDSFVEMSGYSRQELMGQPQCILRHPDMPAVVFRGMWNDLAARRRWHGYVKNLRKDGAYYWVYATIVPNIRNGVAVGYTSVRRKPSRARINEVLQVYRKFLKQD